MPILERETTLNVLSTLSNYLLAAEIQKIINHFDFACIMSVFSKQSQDIFNNVNFLH